AIDLEADSLHSYHEKVCLAQFTTPGGNVVLDPLRCRDAFAGLGATLADPSILKVAHGADYDVRLLKKDFDFRVANLFDTMIAAQFTGREQVGLAALLLEFFGVTLDKRYQRADWSARPLPPELLAYAALDTAHLFGLRDRLEAELAELGRRHWAQEEFDLLAAVTPGPPRKPWCLDVKGAGRLPPRELAVLQGLLELRDEVARERDRPPFKVMGNDVLLRWAETPPATRRDVLETPGVPKPVLDRLEPKILEAVRVARALPLAECPRLPESRFVPMTGSQERRLKRLKAARQAASERLKLAAGLLVNSATLERLARMEPAEALAALPSALKRWQREALGDALGEALTPSASSPPAEE
ncbi:MAG: ribonuclease D, partial [Deltaproteobacteria bacterium]|nr:ribonuclease D [Deltaproteobacteria bacterium]